MVQLDELISSFKCRCSPLIRPHSIPRRVSFHPSPTWSSVLLFLRCFFSVSQLTPLVFRRDPPLPPLPRAPSRFTCSPWPRTFPRGPSRGTASAGLGRVSRGERSAQDDTTYPGLSLTHRCFREQRFGRKRPTKRIASATVLWGPPDQRRTEPSDDSSPTRHSGGGGGWFVATEIYLKMKRPFTERSSSPSLLAMVADLIAKLQCSALVSQKVWPAKFY